MSLKICYVITRSLSNLCNVIGLGLMHVELWIGPGPAETGPIETV